MRDGAPEGLVDAPYPECQPGPEVVTAAQTYFALLDRVETGLGERIARFVLGNGNGDVLEVLSAKTSLTMSVLQNDFRGYDTPEGKAIIAAKQAITTLAVENNLPMATRLAGVMAFRYHWITAERDPRRLAPPHAGLVAFCELFKAARRPKQPTMAQVEWAAERLSCSTEEIFSTLYRPGANRGWVEPREPIVGFVDFLARNEENLLNWTAEIPEPALTAVLEDIRHHRLLRGEFLRLALAVASAPQKALARLGRFTLQAADEEPVLRFLDGNLKTAPTEVRKAIVEALVDRGTPAARAILKRALKEQSVAGVRRAIEAALQRMDAPPTANLDQDGSLVAPPGGKALRAIDGSAIIVPPVPALPESAPLPVPVAQALRSAFEELNRAIDQANAELVAAGKKTLVYPVTSSDEIDAVIAFLTDGSGRTGDAQFPVAQFALPRLEIRYGMERSLPRYKMEGLKKFVCCGFDPIHATRMTIAGGYHHNGLQRSIIEDLSDAIFLQPLSHVLAAGADFRSTIALAQTWGLKPHWPMERLLASTYHNEVGLPEPLPVSIFYYMLDHLDLMEAALHQRMRADTVKLSAEHALTVLGSLPKIPTELLPALIEFGLTGHKSQRKRARTLLEPAVGIDQTLIARLSDSKKEVRAEAAEWIGQRRLAIAEEPLRKALKKEKSEESRAAILTALARIGADISDEFSERNLNAEAESGLAAASKSLDWFPFAALPSVHWQNGKTVPVNVVKWWIVLADKLKNPAGNALFDLYLDRLRKEDSEKLGLFVLQAFISRDTSNCGEGAASAFAKERADQNQQSWLAWHQRDPARAALHPFDYGRTFALAKSQQLSIHPNSCSENRGILAISVRAPGPEAGDLVRRYLKDHGSKVNQSKALLTALARNPSPAAIQVVLGAANRLKQKTTQALAGELVQAIAETRGWTADELADRTIPTGGFDETGEMKLDCGDNRDITAKYRGDSKIELVNAEGKPVKALPAARDEDDKDSVAAAKKALANARKEVKQVETLQQGRLYEAMCVERTWPLDTWITYLKAHPIAGRLCQRLVWLALDAEGRILSSFRLLDDGSLSNAADEPVTLDGAAAVKLAHAVLFEPADAKGWMDHLIDYEVAPLFAQFGKGDAAVAPLPDATTILDREGWIIDNFKLAGLVDKLGYERGEVSDGGGFTEYIKRFEGAHIRATLKFTGSYVGATDKFPCAIETMNFQRIRQGSKRGGAPVNIGEVPPVLLAECINDLVMIAGAGSGFDQDWRSKSSY